MEHVVRETHLEAAFGREAFGRAFARFHELYGVRPLRARCAPDVLARFCELYAPTAGPHQHSTRLAFDGVPIVAGVLAPGTIVFEGEVDEERMGDW